MPNRIIKESICTSENVDQLTEFQEVFFYRLMVNCDDFGRFDARPKLLSSRLFPLRNVDTETVEETLKALQDADLIIVYVVDGHPYLQMKTWGKHQQGRATKSKYPAFAEGVLQSDDSICNQMISDDINGNQTESDDSKCPRIRNRIRNTISDNRNRNTREDDDNDPLISDEDAQRIQREHNRLLDAAEYAGFIRNNATRDRLIKLYAEHGLEKVLDGIGACVQQGVPKLAYLEAVLKGTPRKEKPKVIAQDFGQRDYGDVQDEMMRDLAAEMAAFKAGGM